MGLQGIKAQGLPRENASTNWIAEKLVSVKREKVARRERLLGLRRINAWSLPEADSVAALTNEKFLKVIRKRLHFQLCPTALQHARAAHYYASPGLHDLIRDGCERIATDNRPHKG
jgi:hypothetical protein